MRLVRYPDPVLNRETKRVNSFEGLQSTVQEMFEVMYRSRGIGLAATQVGLGIRLFVSNLAGEKGKKDQEEVFVNPEIIERVGEVREEEACLSLPGLSAEIVRAEKVTLRYRGLDGKERTQTAEGLKARMFQHETDHLDGILIANRMTPADRAKWASHLKSMEEEYHKQGRGRPPAAAGTGL